MTDKLILIIFILIASLFSIYFGTLLVQVVREERDADMPQANFLEGKEIQNGSKREKLDN